MAELETLPIAVMVFPTSAKVPDVRVRLVLTLMLLDEPSVMDGVVDKDPITRLAKLVRLEPVPVIVPVPVKVVVLCTGRSNTGLITTNIGPGSRGCIVVD